MKFSGYTFLATALISFSIATAQINIIQIVADDLGWVDLSTDATNLGNGSNFYQTPNIDALASGGMSFTSAYVQHVCSPTRACLLTGQYSSRNGVYTVGALNGVGDSTLLDVPGNSNAIDNNAITIAEVLQNAGYITAHFGKFHCTSSTNQITVSHGFTLNIGGTNSGAPSGTVPYFAEEVQPGVWQFGNSHSPELDVYANPYTQNYIDNFLIPIANGNDPNFLTATPKHLNDAMADAAVDFLTARASDGNSFFMNVAFNAVHTQINARSDLEEKFQSIPPTSDPNHDSPGFAGLLEGMDQAIGRIVNFVESNGLAENTLIVFISDNGGSTGQTDNFPLAAGKGSFTDGGIRVPLIAYLPGTIESGVVNDEVIHAVDFYRTYAALAGAQLPSSNTHPIDGASFATILTGDSNQLDRRSIFYHFPGYQNNARTPFTASIHDAPDGTRYKMFYNYEQRTFDLYNLTADLSETSNLTENGLETRDFSVASCLSQEINAWLNDAGAALPTVRATGATVPPVSHTPEVNFALDNPSAGAILDGQSEAVLDRLGIRMLVQAAGQDPEFETNNVGVGIRSDLDTGGINQQRRINGALTVPERIVVAFDRDIVIKRIGFNQLDNGGAETVVIEHVSGDNPFTNLNGYQTNGFATQADRLTFARSDNGNNNFDLRLGTLDQDEILLTAGSRISITVNPATGGGAMLTGLSVAIPDFIVADVNTDGSINLLDVAPFVDLLSNGTYRVEADLNKDGEVNLLDVRPFVIALLLG